MSFNSFNKIPLLLVCTGLESRKWTNWDSIIESIPNNKKAKFLPCFFSTTPTGRYCFFGLDFFVWSIYWPNCYRVHLGIHMPYARSLQVYFEYKLWRSPHRTQIIIGCGKEKETINQPKIQIESKKSSKFIFVWTIPIRNQIGFLRSPKSIKDFLNWQAQMANRVWIKIHTA